MDNEGQEWTRRSFLQSSAAAALAAGPLGRIQADQPNAESPKNERKPKVPVVIASGNGLEAVKKAMAMIMQKADPLDAVVAGVNIVEDDPNDHSVGLGGLPNEDGVVELDASCMHGPTHKAGAVGALRNIRNPSSVAKLIMQRTEHVLLVGEGALRFAKAEGFKEEDLLTDEAREMWLEWKESRSKTDNWLSPEDLEGERHSRAASVADRIWGTINSCAVDHQLNLAGVTSTSGLAFKIPGRVGDSPIIGAGLYVDNKVGAAGATGRGESCLQNCSSFYIVELMRGGMDPEQACLEALKRVVEHNEPRLRDKEGHPNFGLTFYALAKDGRYGSASIHSGVRFAVHDGTEARLQDSAYLYEAPPAPKKMPTTRRWR